MNPYGRVGISDGEKGDGNVVKAIRLQARVHSGVRTDTLAAALSYVEENGLGTLSIPKVRSPYSLV